ncbi:3-oxoacyl-ACP reductase [Virgibacillus sp. NKC19-16]|uniref:3-oxoacyl-ACP reductase n=1 Tax=Virgibacillus salidurans TaxID=2831673 RepID=UPI001F249D46|nr:3-oxoacyl-ACP reductase [Virgibacillus sp. NKC19-16]UJL46356.1 3-oxoacyl-ACP reductase [Virgibacillus sp. NKC19-16]
MGKLDGKVTFITGAGSGMGRSQAILFAKEGAKVIAADINVDGVQEVVDQIKSDGGEALAVETDVSKKDSVEKAVNKELDHFGQIDVLSNTAGILDDYAPSLETSEDLWDKIMNINLKGIYYLTNAVLPQMVEREKGTVINVASLASFVAGGGGAAYTAAKHGVAGYTKQLAYDYGKKGIKANAIAPGSVKTGLTEEILVEGSDAEERANEVPAGRYGQPEEIANVALFLASDDSSFMHGAVVPVDGGWTIQ